MKNNISLKKVEDYAKKNLSKDKTGHDTSHVYRVFKNALKIAKKYPKADLEILKASCFLHDIAFKDGFVKNHNLIGEKQSERILKNFKFPEEKIGKVSKAIRLHCGTVYGDLEDPKKMSIEAQILRDADNLDALGSIGIIRMINFCNSQNFPIFKSKEDSLNDSIYGGMNFLLTYLEKMLTKEGKILCQEKIKIVKDFLNELLNEMNIS